MNKPTLPPDSLATLLADLPLDELGFTPVPVKPRHDGWSPERQRAFIHRLALGGCVATAARAVGKSTITAYALRRRPGAQSFVAAWDRAIGWGEERIADIALERALCGQVTTIYRYGTPVGERLSTDNAHLKRVLSRDQRRPPRAKPRELKTRAFPS